jgi:hypothetical protein
MHIINFRKTFVICLQLFLLINIPHKILSLQEINKDVSKRLGSNLKRYQVGMLTKVPDGALEGNDLMEAMNDQLKRNNGEAVKSGDVGIVYMDENLRNKKLGKFRIKGKGIHLLFPDDNNTIKYQNFKDNENFQHFMEQNKIDFEKNKLREAELDFKKNPFKEILDEEKKLLKDDVLRVKRPTEYTTHLLNMAVEKEQEIYNDMIKNELQEIKIKRYNNAYYNPVYRINKINPNLRESLNYKDRLFK